MKKLNILIFFIVFSFIFFNIYFFYLSIMLSDKISFYEEKIEKLHHENINLEKHLSQISSLYYARKIAEKMDFIENLDNVYFLENLKYTLAVK